MIQVDVLIVMQRELGERRAMSRVTRSKNILGFNSWFMTYFLSSVPVNQDLLMHCPMFLMFQVPMR
jgi:hypothetical protein